MHICALLNTLYQNLFIVCTCFKIQWILLKCTPVSFHFFAHHTNYHCQTIFSEFDRHFCFRSLFEIVYQTHALEALVTGFINCSSLRCCEKMVQIPLYNRSSNKFFGYTREASLLKPFQKYDGLCSKEDCASFQKQDHHFESHLGPYFHTYFNLLLLCSRFVVKLRLASFGRCDLFVIKSR